MLLLTEAVMPNFSDDPEKKNMLSEAPGFVRFFFDPKRPIALRAGIAAVLALIFFLPLFTGGKSKKPVSPSQPPPVVDSKSIPKPETKDQADSLATDAGLPTEEESPEEPVPQATGTPTPQPETAAPVFHKIAGTFPVPIAIREGAAGTVWIVTVQDVTEFRNGEAIRKLNGQSYEGLFNSDMRSLSAATITPEGEIWTGSLDGEVMHYANYDWKIAFESREPIKDRILAIGQQGTLVFLGTESGLWKFDQSTGNLTRYKSFSNVRINTFSRGSKGELLMGAQNGAWRLTEKGWEQILPSTGGPGIISIDSHSEDILLLGNGDDLTVLQISSGKSNHFLAGLSVTALLPGEHGSLWVGLQNGGLRYFDGKDWYAADSSHGAPGDFVSHLSRDSKQRIWLGVTGRGAYYADELELIEWIKPFKIVEEVLDNTKPRVYENACKAVESELQKINQSGDIAKEMVDGQLRVFLRGKQICPTGIAYRSSSGFIIARKTGGFVGIANGRSQPFDIPKDYVPASIKQIFIDSKNRVWFGRSSGPLLLTDGKWEDFSTVPELAGNLVQVFEEDAQGTIWVGTAPAYDHSAQRATQPGLHSYTNGTWAHFTYEQGLPGWTVTALARSNDGKIIVGTPTGFAYAVDGKLLTPTLPKKVTISAVMWLTQDKQGSIWMAHLFFHPGVTYYDGADLHPFDEPGRFFSPRVMGIGIDANDKFWLVDPNGKVGIYSRDMLLAEPPEQAAPEGEAADEADVDADEAPPMRTPAPPDETSGE